MTVYYTTAAAVQAEPGCSALDNGTVEALIVRAEDITDELLGAWSVDDATGRKIVQADVEAWQWQRLGRFVSRVAARLHTDVDVMGAGQWNSVSGPDFSFSGPLSGGWEQRLGSELVMVLNGTGLRRLTGRVSSRRLTTTRSELEALWWNE